MIAMGSDHGGFELKELLKERLLADGYEVEDFGVHSTDMMNYPDIALPVARAVAKGGYEFGILICGTGIGVSIAANKVHGIRAALCGDCFSARMAKEHNDANIITLGARTLGRELAWEIVNAYMNAHYLAGIHAPRVQVLSEL